MGSRAVTSTYSVIVVASPDRPAAAAALLRISRSNVWLPVPVPGVLYSVTERVGDMLLRRSYGSSLTVRYG